MRRSSMKKRYSRRSKKMRGGTESIHTARRHSGGSRKMRNRSSRKMRGGGYGPPLGGMVPYMIHGAKNAVDNARSNIDTAKNTIHSNIQNKMNGGRSRKMRGGEIAIPPTLGKNKPTAGGSRKRRGGMPYGGPLSPHSFDGQGVGTSGVDLQFVAGNAA